MGRASFFGGKVFQLSVVKMLFLHTVSFTFSLLLINIGEREGLMAQGNSNLTDRVHGSTGHGPNVNVNITEMMQILMNQTAEIENLKQQTAEIENMKQQAAEIESLRELTSNLTKQTENDRSTIQILQDKLFTLEAELDRLNTSKPTSTQDLSSYLSDMNHLIQTMVTKEANDKNLTHLLNVTVKNFEDQNVQVQYTSLSLIDVHIMPEMNGSLNKQLEDKINDYIIDQIASNLLFPKENYNKSYNNWGMFKIASHMT